MRNLYFTVDFNVRSEYKSRGHHTGFSRILFHEGKQFTFTIITECNDGIADTRMSEEYIINSFSKWVEDVTNCHIYYSFSKKRIKREICQLIVKWNNYMFEHSCHIYGMNSSVAIIIMCGKWYLSFQTGKNTLISCSGRGLKVNIADEDLLGRHSDCRILTCSGRLRYGDTFVMCSNHCGNNTIWYIKKLIRRRRRYTRLHGRGMSGSDVLNNMCNTLADNGVFINTIAILCCERTE